MMESGMMTNSPGRGFSIMSILSYSKVLTTSTALMKLRISGRDTKVNMRLLRIVQI
jgi:hypothetical protein